jgi:coatomer subunit beta'
MNIAINPKDTNTFASACLDRTVKIWSIGSSTPNFTMDANEKGVNYVDFYPGPDKPYIVTTGDDKTVKVWDYLSKSCVQTMEGHTNNVSFAVFHPNLPIIVSGSEDGTIKIWNSNTYRLENTLSYSLERAWCTSLRKDANEVAVGFDEGVVVINVGLSVVPRKITLNWPSLVATNQRSAWIPPANSSIHGTNKYFPEISK